MLMLIQVLLCLLLVNALYIQAYWVKPTFARALVTKPRLPTDLTLLACRRNNKDEKRRRNKEYARKYASKTGESRKKVVVEQKRAIVASNEAKFQAELFHLTTDEDMPAYSGFQFAS